MEIEELVKKYKYRKLPKKLSEEQRKKYKNELNSNFKINGDKINIYSTEDTRIAIGYERIVIGDYGAYLEIKHEDIIIDNLRVQEGQEYRYREPYCNNIKYYWLATKDNSHVKIYEQVRGVTYADYKPGMYYVSPYEIKLNNGD